MEQIRGSLGQSFNIKKLRMIALLEFYQSVKKIMITQKRRSATLRKERSAFNGFEARGGKVFN